MTFSLLINHAPWCTARAPQVRLSLQRLIPDPDDGWIPWWVHDVDYRGGGQNPAAGPVDFTLAQWRWCTEQEVDHHVLLTDDVETCPRFWSVLEAMVTAVPDDVLGLICNHPEATDLHERGRRWYRTNAWVHGAAYVVPHAMMRHLYAWASKRGPEGSVGGLGWADDSELNEWITCVGPGQAYHPIPSPVRHLRVPSTWVKTPRDDYSHERVSWSEEDVPLMRTADFWTLATKRMLPMLPLP